MQDHYWPLEDFPMTFQVGLVGGDGIVLASDLQHIAINPYPNTRQTWQAPKITIVEGRNMAYCCAGGEWADETIQSFLEGGTEPIGQMLRMAAMSVMQAAGEKQRNPVWCGAILLVHGARLFHLNTGMMCSAYPIVDKKTQGDSGNAAQFLIERYFLAGMPTAQLVTLAAYTVLMANRMNPAGVKGLEVCICTNSGFTMITSEQISTLEDSFSDFDSYLAARLAVPIT